jgi:N-acetylglucosaminyl-diphospho-decaprenol L-rhamnosyltransferase
MKELTIVIVTYNSAGVIEACLSNLNFTKYDVVVVDNASADDSVKIIESKFPQVKLIKLSQNLGYGRGNNAALKQIKTDFAMILNPDAMFFEKDIELVLSKMKSDDSIALGGPLILNKYPLDEKELQENLDFIKKDLSTIKDKYYERIDDYLSVRFVIGSSIILKMEVFRKIGFYNENFFLYYEDDELCGRIRENGYKNIIVPEALAYHIGGKSSGFSLRGVYKKNWHLTWSKLYWKRLKKGYLRAKRSAIKTALVFFIKTIFVLATFDAKKILFNLGGLSGSLAFFIGLKAFNKNDNARG